jgi:acyl-CoA thioesterase-2
MWGRPRGPVADDAVTRACVLTYFSDMAWAFGAVASDLGGPSLDHAVWFHRDVDVEDWMLLDLSPVSTVHARGLYTGTIHDRSGTLAAVVAQEALFRARRPRPASGEGADYEAAAKMRPMLWGV